MTESEVKTIDDCINELRKHRNVYLKRSTPWRVVNRALHLIEQYRAIGTVEELKALKEKSVAKKVQYDEYGKEEGYPYCKCGKCLIDDLVGVSYCPNCGQKLDWE